MPVDLRDSIEEGGGIFSHIRQNDLIVHHPYESFNQSVERFIIEASLDPQTIAIKCTLYRTDKNSKIIRALIDAANLRKQVACVIELKARFDEERNIQWANELVNAGVHVVHGMVGLKTHSKMALVVRKEFDGIVSYAHLGTGNYNALTSRLYTDLSYFTFRKDITSEVQEAFNFLTGFSLKHDYKKLLIAPINMKEKFIEMIYDEAMFGKKGRIIAKMNQLEDKDIIGALYDASCAGVKIDLSIRGFCSLKAGIKGVSENIKVISILGRFLEHSRIYFFGNGKQEPLEGSYYIGSADWMYRNLENRVEVITPIQSTSNKSKLWDILTTEIQDKRLAWEQNKNGEYKLRKPDNKEQEKGSQELLIQKTNHINKIKLS
jgi:polyphosphate kinase